MNLKKYLQGLRVKYLGTPITFSNELLLGKQVQVIKGTIKQTVDYDDAWFYELVKRSTIFFDIGANIGYTALIAKLTNPHRPVVLVEANKEAMSYAARNLIYNGLVDFVSFEPILLGDTERLDVEFFTIGVGAAGSIISSHAETAAAMGTSQFINMTTLDNLVLKLNLIPDFVKIDVEGAENLVLQGAIQLATKRKTRFLIELHRSDETPMMAMGDNLISWCKRQEYKAWFLTDKSELISGQAIAQRGRCHVLVQPYEWEFPTYLIPIKESDPIRY
jgi:FkbM family methyltransferase